MTSRRLLLLALGLVLMDRVGGAALDEVARPVRTGERSGGVARATLAARHADVLVLGSSRVRRHIDPRILTEGLGRPVINGGCDGQGVIYSRAILGLLAARGGHPDHVVVDLNPFDLVDPRPERLGVLAPFYGESPVADALLRARDPFAGIKLASRLYRHNSSALPALARRLSSPRPVSFDPLPPRLGPAPADGAPSISSSASRARGLAHYTALVREARALGSRVSFLVGPRRGGWPADEANGLAALVDSARELDVPVIDLGAVPVAPEEWVDSVHFDERAATRYSRALAVALAGDQRRHHWARGGGTSPR